jgi:hypothetical protein
MTTAEIQKSRKDDELLSRAEITVFRSILGALLWLCLTRIDVIADTCLLQQEVTAPTIGHLRAANSVVLRAKKYREGVGLYFRPLQLPLKVLITADAGANIKHTNYYREGCGIFIMHDDLRHSKRQVRLEHSDKDNLALSGAAHWIGGFGRKAKRVPWSTSQGETLAAVGAEELGQMIAARVTEILCGRRLSLHNMTTIWNHGLFSVSVDHMTDCNDMFETVTGDKALPQDRGHRLYVAAMRELRLTGRIRRMMLVPTHCMIADCLTKSMLSEQMMKFLSCGLLDFDNGPKHNIQSRLLLRTRPLCNDQDIRDILSYEKLTTS